MTRKEQNLSGSNARKQPESVWEQPEISRNLFGNSQKKGRTCLGESTKRLELVWERPENAQNWSGPNVKRSLAIVQFVQIWSESSQSWSGGPCKGSSGWRQGLPGFVGKKLPGLGSLFYNTSVGGTRQGRHSWRQSPSFTWAP